MTLAGKQRISELEQNLRKRGIDFISTPYDVESARFLYSLKVDAIKVASSDNNFSLPPAKLEILCDFSFIFKGS